MRTLFLKEYKAKYLRRRVIAIACGVAAVLLTALVLIDDAFSWHDVSSGLLLAFAGMAVLAILAGRWALRRRQQDAARSLKDSALW